MPGDTQSGLRNKLLQGIDAHDGRLEEMEEFPCAHPGMVFAGQTNIIKHALIASGFLQVPTVLLMMSLSADTTKIVDRRHREPPLWLVAEVFDELGSKFFFRSMP